MQAADVLIHFDDPLDQDQQNIVESEMHHLEGVISTRFTQPHLLLALYDPGRTRSATLLKAAKWLACRAQLVAI